MANILSNEQKQLIVDTIRKTITDVSIIYLFGSYAKGVALESSDIDIAVLGNSNYSNINLWRLAQELSAGCGHDMDIVDLRQTTTVMRVQIVAESEHLYDDGNEESIVFEDFVFSDYARLNEERRGILEDISSRGNIYG